MPTPHENFVALMTAPGAASIRAAVQGDDLHLTMAGGTWRVFADGTLTRDALTGTRYSASRTADVLMVVDDGTVYGCSQSFTAGAAPLCELGDEGAQAIIAEHLAATFASRALQ